MTAAAAAAGGQCGRPLARLISQAADEEFICLAYAAELTEKPENRSSIG